MGLNFKSTRVCILILKFYTKFTSINILMWQSTTAYSNLLSGCCCKLFSYFVLGWLHEITYNFLFPPVTPVFSVAKALDSMQLEFVMLIFLAFDCHLDCILLQIFAFIDVEKCGKITFKQVTISNKLPFSVLCRTTILHVISVLSFRQKTSNCIFKFQISLFCMPLLCLFCMLLLVLVWICTCHETARVLSSMWNSLCWVWRCSKGLHRGRRSNY